MGKVLQVQRAELPQVSTTSVIPYDDTIPQNTEGAAVTSITITPKSATSTLYMRVATADSDSVSAGVTLAIFKDADADAIAVGMCNSNNTRPYMLELEHSEGSADTSERTYYLRLGSHTGSTVRNYVLALGSLGGVYNFGSFEIIEVEG